MTHLPVRRLLPLAITLALAADRASADTWTVVATHPDAAAEADAWSREIHALQSWNGMVWASYGWGDGSFGTKNVKMRPFDPAAGTFSDWKFSVPAKEVATLRVQQGRLFVPVADNRDGTEYGVSGAETTSSTWALMNAIPSAVGHRFDVATLTGSDLWVVGQNANETSAVAWRSTDQGRTWTESHRVYPSGGSTHARFYGAGVLHNRLWVQPAYSLTIGPAWFFDGNTWTAAGFDLEGQFWAPIEFADHLVYFGTQPGSPSPLLAFDGFGNVQTVRSGAINLTVHEDTLYVLQSTIGGYGVAKTTDLVNWTWVSTQVPGNATAITAADGTLFLGTANSQILRWDAAISTKPHVSVVPTDPAGAEGATTARFTVRRSGSTAAPLTAFFTMTGTATLNGDYFTLPGAVTIPAGATSAEVFVIPASDALWEGPETAILTLAHDPFASVSPYDLGEPRDALVTIYEATQVSVEATDPWAFEDDQNPDPAVYQGDPAVYTVRRDGSTALPLAVNYTVNPGNGANRYEPLPGFVTIPAGAETASVTIAPKDNNTVNEPEVKDVVLTLTASTANEYQLGTPYLENPATTYLIDDDRSTVTVTAIGATALEDGSLKGTFRFSRSGGNNGIKTVVKFSVAGEATSGVDYTALPASVTIVAGQTFVDLQVSAINDGPGDDLERIILTLTSTGVSYTVAEPSTATVIVSEQPGC